MENELEFYKSQRERVLNLINELNKELILIELDFVMGSTTFEEFVKLRDSIKFRIDVAKEVDEEMERLLNNLMMDELARIEWTEEDDEYYDYGPWW